jgi:hypothetical protein
MAVKNFFAWIREAGVSKDQSWINRSATIAGYAPFIVRHNA